MEFAYAATADFCALRKPALSQSPNPCCEPTFSLVQITNNTSLNKKSTIFGAFFI